MAINSLHQTTRLVGMNSGFDTDSLIETMLRASQAKIDNKNRAITKLQWKQDSLNSVKNDINDFKNTFLSSLGAKSMRASSSYNTTVASLTGKNADAISVKTSTASSLGSMSVGQIVSLAKGANTSSEKSVSKSGSGFSGTTTLENMEFTGGEKIQFDKDGKADIEINGTTITLDKTDTLDSMMKKVNDSGAGVKMSYDRLSDKFSLESTTVGPDSQLSFSGDALGLMGLDSGKVNAGTKAQVYINNELVERDTNTFEFRGVTLTLNRTTEAGDEDTNVTLKRDVSEAVGKIKEFVNSYNSLISKLEGLLKERKTTNEAKYTPLTDEEKKAMTEDEVKDWEKIAKKGVLYGDADLKKMVDSLRGALFDAVEGAGISAASIGLSTGSYFDGKGGQIVLDETKLTAALEKDPDQVMKVFSQASNTGDAATDYKNRGLVNRMDAIMNTYISDRQKTTLTGLEESIRKGNEQITTLQNKMYLEQERLYRKFAAMETAMQKMQEQGSSVTSLLGGM